MRRKRTEIGRAFRRRVATWLCVAVVAAVPLSAQDSVFVRARQLVVSGNGAAGRLLVDSVVAATPPGSPEYAEALYWRASLASTTTDAERDYRRIVVEYPLSPRSGDALLQLAYLEVARADRANAATHLQRFLLENPAAVERGRAGYLLARVLLEQNELARGCTALGRSRRDIPRDSIELRNQLDYFAPRCVGVDTSGVIATATPATLDSVAAPKPNEKAPATASRTEGRYTLQVAAYATRAAADALAAKLKARGFDSRVAGKAKPFRVRIGHYPTRAEATAANKRVAARGIKAVVTDTADEK